MKKNYWIIVAVIGVLLLGGGYMVFSKKEVQLKQTIEAGNGILRVNNVGNSNIRIVPARTSQITLDMEGPEKELKKIRFFKLGSDIEFSVSDEWKNVRGTITVPEGMLIDLPDEDGEEESDFIRLGGGSPYNTITISNSGVSYNDQGGEPSATGTDDDQGGDDGGQTDGDQGGDTPSPSPPPPTEPNPVPPPPDEGDEEADDDEPETTEYAPEEPTDPNVRCSIKLRQEERNDCCQTAFADEPHPDCAHTGYWLFNYLTRLCYYHCFHPCNVGTEEERNQCCATEHHYDTTPPCIGEWEYGDATSGCFYRCFTEEELEEYFGDDEGDLTDVISLFCSQHSNPDQCCDYNLKNELSIGPRPGFPDCIGLWEFNSGGNKCEFRCASHGEMLEILEQLEEQAQN